jgi:UDP-N-acetylmuramoylalanine--D-glutamate ligase
VITAHAFNGRHYAVYGLARSGLATAEALLASGAKVSAWDSKVEARQKAPAGTDIVNIDEADLSQFDSIVVTPGLPLNRHPIAKRALAAGIEIIGDIELFARARPELPPHRLVGITGTNGKSTTTALLHHILEAAGVPARMGGNIGLPILSQDPLKPNEKGLGVYVLELSSYQIDLTRSLDCDIAVLLNVTPDHLDRYDGFDAYAQSKARLFAMQSDRQDSIVATDDPVTRAIADGLDSPVRVSAQDAGTSGEWPSLKGPHNAQNVAAASAAARLLGLSDEAIAEGLRTYGGLPHRMERVGEKDGVVFVNDSKGTNPTATAPALAAFDSIRWICGGQAKSESLDECAPFFGNVRSAYTIGEAAELFERLLAPHMPVKNCGKLADAVREAAKDSKAGDTVLLSPACASFDQFKDFEDRGNRFRDCVGTL